MNFPPKMANRYQRSEIRSSPLTPKLRVKLTMLVTRHEQMKMAYNELRSQIKTGLIQAEDVFASLAIPLMKLVGLKTVEMAEEGRFSTIIMDVNFPCGRRRNEVGCQPPVVSPIAGEDNNGRIRGYEEESCSTKATIAGKEFIERQRTQLMQLTRVLKQIETQVNSRQNDILQTLANHRISLQKFFQKAICYVPMLNGEDGNSLLVTQKLLQAIFENMAAVLSSVEGSFEGLMHDLADQMCNPMVEYLNCLKSDMKNGTSMRLLATLEEMKGALVEGRLELEDARKKAREAEERKIEAVCKLKETEERLRKMNKCLGYNSETQKGPMDPSFPHKFLGMVEDNSKHDKLLWDLLKKKRKYKQPESPMEPKGLLHFESNNKHVKSKRLIPLIRQRPVTTSLRKLGPQTPCLNTLVPLGSSPSATIDQVVSYKRSITP